MLAHQLDLDLATLWLKLAFTKGACVSSSLVARCLLFLVFWGCLTKNDTPHIWESKNPEQRQQQTIHSLRSPCPLEKPPVETTTSATKEWEAQNGQSRRRTQRVDGARLTQGGIRVAISPQALLVKKKILTVRADGNYKLEFRFRFVCISIGFARIY